MHGELSSCSSGHSGCCSPGFGEKESSKFRKSAGSPGVAVLALVKKSRASFGNHPRAGKFRHAAYVATNVNMYRGEAERPKTCFTWPAWRSN